MTPEKRAKALASEVIKDGVMDWTDWQDDLADMVANALREAIAAEREACAKVAEGEPYKGRYRKWSFWPLADYADDSPTAKFADNIANAIRSRSNEGGEG